MQDINITHRDLFGRVSFGVTGSSVTGLELLIQKITIMLLSDTKVTFFGQIIGGGISAASKFNHSSSNNDYRLYVTDAINSIKKKIAEYETSENVKFVDRLKNIEINELLFDNSTLQITLSLIISTNSSSKNIILPVK